MKKNYEILLEEYIKQNGKNFNESLARAVVDGMWHTNAKGEVVKGEAVTPSEAMMLLDGMDTEKKAKLQWDAYVAANASIHDGIESGVLKSDILKLAKHFWFHDEDMEEGCHKVFWYFFK